MLDIDIFSQIVLGIVSILSNFISALSGGGAGLIQLPALLFLGLPFPKALATHKVASVALGLGASIPHIKRNNLKSLTNIQKKYDLLINLNFSNLIAKKYFAKKKLYEFHGSKLQTKCYLLEKIYYLLFKKNCWI